MAENKITSIHIPYGSVHPVEHSQDPSQLGATEHEVDTTQYAKEWSGYDSKIRVTNSEVIDSESEYGINDHKRGEKEPD